MFFANLVTLLFSGMMIYYGWKLTVMQAATNQYTSSWRSFGTPLRHPADDGGYDVH